ncbi:MAG: succinate dehydrogenase, hydrophobic membrane anchor protein [Gammaproteobacteria bacterium]|nr:succinate dehydrogenase, hydrophobic membrane anchor protein [Gammaproteobacteria bacterium]MDH5729043.1 succinate dehydrogenase, hydrophobic membrane anchor protein [Gammaproteobacteria bacterium]
MSWRAGGVHMFVLQRVSAAYIAGFILLLIILVYQQHPLDYQNWRQLMSQSWISIGFILFWWMILGHAWVGMRDVFMDYLPSAGLRFSALTVLALCLLAAAIWVLRIMLPLVF